MPVITQLRRLLRAAPVTLGLGVALGLPAGAHAAAPSLTVTPAQPFISGQTTKLTLAGNTGTASGMFWANLQINRGDAPCEADYALNDLQEFDEAEGDDVIDDNGQFTNLFSWKPPLPGTYRLCGYLSRTSGGTTTVVKTETTIDVRRPTGTIEATLPKSTFAPGERTALTYKASGETPLTVTLELTDATSACGSSADTNVDIESWIGNEDADALQHGLNVSVPDRPGTFRICGYLSENADNDAIPVVTLVGTPFTVASQAAPAPPAAAASCTLGKLTAKKKAKNAPRTINLVCANTGASVPVTILATGGKRLSTAVPLKNGKGVITLRGKVLTINKSKLKLGGALRFKVTAHASSTSAVTRKFDRS